MLLHWCPHMVISGSSSLQGHCISLIFSQKLAATNCTRHLLGNVGNISFKKNIIQTKTDYGVWCINSESASCDNWCTVGGDGGCRVGEVRAGTTSPMPNHKGFKLQQLVNFQKFSTLRVNSKVAHVVTNIHVHHSSEMPWERIPKLQNMQYSQIHNNNSDVPMIHTRHTHI